MDCWNPIRIPNQRLLKSYEFLKHVENRGVYGYEHTGKDLCSFKGEKTNFKNAFSKHYDFHTKVHLYESLFMYVPCRKCPPCIRRKSSEWSGRLAREIRSHIDNGKKCAFVTLTYDDSYIKDAEKTWRGDIATFFDRLRSKYRRNIRHYCISEYGEKTERFHIHALLFDVPEEFAPSEHLWTDKYNYLHGSSPAIVERWRLGLIDTTIVKTVGAGIYVAGYLNKNKPRKNGQYYVSPIIASNGIGYKDVTQIEISNISSSLACNILPYYEVGGKRYQYPQRMIDKYLSLDDRLKLSALSASYSRERGGSFKVGSLVTRSYSEFQTLINSYSAPIIHYRLKNEDPTLGIKENTDFSNQSTFFPEDKEVVNVTLPKIYSESIIYKYRNIMSNYCPF